MRKIIRKKYFITAAAAFALLISACGNNNSAAEVQDPVEVSVTIECSSILDHISDFDTTKAEFLPEDGIVLSDYSYKASEGDSAFDVLREVCQENGIQMESSYAPLYKNYYVKGINNIYELDCGSNSGWMYSVNGEYLNYGCSEYKVKDGDSIEWRYTCSLGSDIGAEYEE